jgi:hypothetical protein
VDSRLAVLNVKPDEALKEAKLVGRTRQFKVRLHAMGRMAERSASRQDIANALITATEAIHQEATKWRLEGGTDEEGASLVVVIRFEERGVIVTIF